MLKEKKYIIDNTFTKEEKLIMCKFYCKEYVKNNGLPSELYKIAEHFWIDNNCALLTVLGYNSIEEVIEDYDLSILAKENKLPILLLVIIALLAKRSNVMIKNEKQITNEIINDYIAVI